MKKTSGAFWQEIRAILKNKKTLISVTAVALVPLLYCSLFLWAFWDPYEKMDVLPVAVVNQDQGATLNGKELHVGDELVNKLKEGNNFDWQFVSEEEATQGLADTKYYMALKIPADFSAKVASVTSDKPTTAQIEYIPNQSYNFLAAQIGSTAIEKIKSQLTASVTEAYTKTMLGSVQQLASGIGQAGDGAGKLADGAKQVQSGIQLVDTNVAKLADGAGQLSSGLTQADGSTGKLTAGAQDLLNGIKTLDGGAGKLSQGAKPLAEGATNLASGAGDLKTGLAQLNQGAGQLAGGLTQLKQGGDQLATGAGQVAGGTEQLKEGLTASADSLEKLSAGSQGMATGLAQYAAAHPELAQDASFAKLLETSKSVSQGLTAVTEGQKKLAAGAGQAASGASQLQQGLTQLSGKLGEASVGGTNLVSGSAKLQAGADQLAGGAQKLAAGAGALAGGADQLAGGTGKLVSGAEQLAGGTQLLADGTHKLATGAQQVANGTTQLADGTKQLSDGAGQVANGSSELAGKLQAAKTETTSVNTGDDVAKMFASPIKIHEEDFTRVPNYGTGFAPYFMSLALFVGSLILTIVFPVKQPAGQPRSGISWFLSKFGVMVIVGVVQALAVDVVLLSGLGLEVQSVPRFILLTIFTSLTFMALIQFLVTAMADVGRFVAIVLLILQLTTSAGTFPLELLPNWMQDIHAFLPMSYSVFAFKAVISSGDYSAMWYNAGMLLVFLAIFAVFTIIYLTVQSRLGKKNDSNPMQATV
ncbi:YhgE/Pip domain-containing protein [Gorillibacterium massiliense]|uniref:YhgE/Pip domain-containing protein n=1 Tax=Gorillibacterium massiliense TaxID=1280390 RepID=UPI00059288A1|nr:YhgE/Pip domain-containing protein [Gorillibacterium massiliense]